MAQPYDEADSAEIYRVFWRSLEDEQEQFVAELNEEGADVAFRPFAPELSSEYNWPLGSVDVDLDEPFEFEVPARVQRRAGLRPPPPLEPVVGSAAVSSAAGRLPRGSGYPAGSEALAGLARGVAHPVRSSSVAPVTMQPAEPGDEAEAILARAGAGPPFTAMYAAAMLSMAAVGGVAAHAALQPSTPSVAAGGVQPARPAVAARTMLGARGESPKAGVHAAVGFGSSRGVARLREQMVARLEATTGHRLVGPSVHTVPPVVITVPASSPATERADPAGVGGAERGPHDVDGLAAKHADETFGAGATAAPSRGGVAQRGHLDRQPYSETPPGGMAVDWQAPERADRLGTEAQMKATRLRFNRTRFDESFVQREPTRD